RTAVNESTSALDRAESWSSISVQKGSGMVCALFSAVLERARQAVLMQSDEIPCAMLVVEGAVTVAGARSGAVVFEQEVAIAHGGCQASPEHLLDVVASGRDPAGQSSGAGIEVGQMAQHHHREASGLLVQWAPVRHEGGLSCTPGERFGPAVQDFDAVGSSTLARRRSESDRGYGSICDDAE